MTCRQRCTLNAIWRSSDDVNPQWTLLRWQRLVGVRRSVYSWTPARQNWLCFERWCWTPSCQYTRMSDSTNLYFFNLRRRRSFRRLSYFVVTSPFSCMVVILVFARLDHCNAVSAGLPAIGLYTLAPLQRVLGLHPAARSVNDLRPHDHVTQTLKELHWLWIAQRIEYRLYWK